MATPRMEPSISYTIGEARPRGVHSTSQGSPEKKTRRSVAVSLASSGSTPLRVRRYTLKPMAATATLDESRPSSCMKVSDSLPLATAPSHPMKSSTRAVTSPERARASAVRAAFGLAFTIGESPL